MCEIRSCYAHEQAYYADITISETCMSSNNRFDNITAAYSSHANRKFEWFL